ncbi:MAG: cytochrome c family protein [Oricola sp.]
MSSTNLNMYAGAFLGTVFAMMTVGILGEAIFSSEAPEQQGYAISAGEGGAATEAGAAEPAVELVSPLLASADAAAGETVFKKCVACHTIEDGGANKTGPNLWNIVNRPVASHEGFKYSAAMTEFGADGKVWDYEHLSQFTHKPKALVSGTAMGFAGLPKLQDRANLIAYLREQSASPAPLPDANAAPAAEAAPAATEGTTTTQ